MSDLFEHAERFGSDFDGSTFEPRRDGKRLNAQLTAVYSIIKDGQWRTLSQIAEQAGAPEPSVSARLRDLKKQKFGSYQIEKQYLGSGLWQYRMVPNAKD
jgi:hypothetical protein